MDKQTAEELIRKYRTQTCTAEEKAIVESWYLNHLENSDSAPSQEMITRVNQRMEKAIFDQLQPEKRTRKILPRMGIAASILLCLSIGGYFLLSRKAPVQTIAKVATQDASPGSSRAILTLNNGKQIVLSTAKNGILTSQGSTQISKTNDGEIIYRKDNSAGNQPAVVYNTISTPRGGQWKLTLEDGSGVWLNAGSTIRYPATFAASERTVEITGEVYFEIAKDKSRPFRVSSHGQTVEVLGTHFNINAYADEQSIKTTLLEGSIRVIKGHNVRLIKPGQQATTKITESEITIQDHVNLATEVAWKDGYFRFDNADLPAIMRQFSRWYDVEVIYKGNLAEHAFNGKISRQASLSRVLKILSLGGQNFKIEGRKLIVLP